MPFFLKEPVDTCSTVDAGQYNNQNRYEKRKIFKEISIRKNK
jgi:hypothetical protein